jgi:alpha-glucosidase
MYYGDELGMHDVPIPAEVVQDPLEKNVPGLGLGRDPGRTPMQWDQSPNAGFTAGTPWLPVANDYRAVNVAAEREDPTSVLTLYRRLIALRRAEEALAVGSYASVMGSEDVMGYLRQASARPQTLAALGLHGVVALSTHLDRQGDAIHDSVELRDNEGVIAKLDSPSELSCREEI